MAEEKKLPDEVRLTDATMKYMQELMTQAVKTGITESMTQDNARLFFKTGMQVVQEEATQHTGRFVIGGLRGLVKKALTFITLGLIVYSVGGWSALVSTFKAIFQGSAP